MRKWQVEETSYAYPRLQNRQLDTRQVVDHIVMQQTHGDEPYVSLAKQVDNLSHVVALLIEQAILTQPVDDLIEQLSMISPFQSIELIPE